METNQTLYLLNFLFKQDMKQIIIFLFIIFFSVRVQAQEKYDLVIVGGTPGGIMTAVAAAKEGKTSVILERARHIGGLPANGLGATDLQTRGATTGLFSEFLNRNHQHYLNAYGPDSRQVELSQNGFHFEPSVAEQTFLQMINDYKAYITVCTMRQFDSEPGNVTIENDRICSISILNRDNNTTETYSGTVFIDATYEGDLAAAAGVPFKVGREGRSEYNEVGAGRAYKYWAGGEQDCSTFIGDNAIQAYNYRLCLTRNPAKRRTIEKPENYNRNEYVSLAEDIWLGRHTGIQMADVTREMMEENRLHIAKGNKTKIPGDKWGIQRIVNMYELPNDKSDSNNQHISFVSTDLPEENWPWPTSSWEWRDRYAKRLQEYTLGLLWFVQNDKDVPKHFRESVKEWGLTTEEYVDNQNFPRQVYVREGRRIEGEYFFTAHDARPVADGKRPPIHSTSITASHYALDSHAVRKREPGKINLEGFISYGAAPYTVPYGVIVPKHIDNLLTPVPVSASHIGFSTLRMEPCWMALGQAAGVAASISIDQQVKLKNVDINKIQQKLIEQQATLIYFKDLTVDHPDFAMAQYLGVRGYFPDWNAELNEKVDLPTAKLWSRLSGQTVAEGEVRREVLNRIFRTINQ